MDRERRELEAKEQQKAIASQATALVDGGGGWLQCKLFVIPIVQLMTGSFSF